MTAACNVSGIVRIPLYGGQRLLLGALQSTFWAGAIVRRRCRWMMVLSSLPDPELPGITRPFHNRCRRRRRRRLGLADVEFLWISESEVPPGQLRAPYAACPSGHGVSCVVRWNHAQPSSGWRRSCRATFPSRCEQVHRVDFSNPFLRRLMRRVRAPGTNKEKNGLSARPRSAVQILTASSAMSVVRL